jgi:hypothetical protein
MFVLNLLLSGLISSIVWVKSAGDLGGVSIDHLPREEWQDKERRKCNALKMPTCEAADSVPLCGFLSVAASVPHYGNFIGNWTLFIDSVRVPVQFSSVQVSSDRHAVGVKIVPLRSCPRVVRVVDLSGRFVEYKTK